MAAHVRPVAVALAAGLSLTACGKTPVDVPGDEVVGGAVGPDVDVTDDLGLRQVQLEFPLDGGYATGDDAELFLAITNTSTAADRLLDVRGPDFADALLRTGGTPGAIQVPENDTVYIGAEGAPSVLLEDLDGPLRSSQSIPVTFVFADAGSVTVDAVVAAEGQDPTAGYDFPDPADDPTTP